MNSTVLSQPFKSCTGLTRLPYMHMLACELLLPYCWLSLIEISVDISWMKVMIQANPCITPAWQKFTFSLGFVFDAIYLVYQSAWRYSLVVSERKNSFNWSILIKLCELWKRCLFMLHTEIWTPLPAGILIFELCCHGTPPRGPGRHRPDRWSSRYVSDTVNKHDTDIWFTVRLLMAIVCFNICLGGDYVRHLVFCHVPCAVMWSGNNCQYHICFSCVCVCVCVRWYSMCV